MIAVEFETTAQDGVIQIPEDLALFKNGKLKVILLQEEEPFSKVKRLFEDTIKASENTDFSKITMEEINEEIKNYRNGL